MRNRLRATVLCLLLASCSSTSGSNQEAPQARGAGVVIDVGASVNEHLAFSLAGNLPIEEATITDAGADSFVSVEFA